MIKNEKMVNLGLAILREEFGEKRVYIFFKTWERNKKRSDILAEKIKIGFVGAGYMGQRAHIANYATLPDVELTALAEGRTETAKAVAQRYGIKTTYSNHVEVCCDRFKEGFFKPWKRLPKRSFLVMER